MYAVLCISWTYLHNLKRKSIIRSFVGCADKSI